jgi:hypothetical protein
LAITPVGPVELPERLAERGCMREHRGGAHAPKLAVGEYVCRRGI